MVIRVAYIRLKLTFSYGKLHADFEKFYFFLLKMTLMFRNLQISKILNTDKKRIFPIPLKVMYITLRYTYFEKTILQ